MTTCWHTEIVIKVLSMYKQVTHQQFDYETFPSLHAPLVSRSIATLPYWIFALVIPSFIVIWNKCALDRHPLLKTQSKKKMGLIKTHYAAVEVGLPDWTK